MMPNRARLRRFNTNIMPLSHFFPKELVPPIFPARHSKAEPKIEGCAPDTQPNQRAIARSRPMSQNLRPLGEERTQKLEAVCVASRAEGNGFWQLNAVGSGRKGLLMEANQLG